MVETKGLTEADGWNPVQRTKENGEKGKRKRANEKKERKSRGRHRGQQPRKEPCLQSAPAMVAGVAVWHYIMMLVMHRLVVAVSLASHELVRMMESGQTGLGIIERCSGGPVYVLAPDVEVESGWLAHSRGTRKTDAASRKSRMRAPDDALHCTGDIKQMC